MKGKYFLRGTAAAAALMLQAALLTGCGSSGTAGRPQYGGTAQAPVEQIELKKREQKDLSQMQNYCEDTPPEHLKEHADGGTYSDCELILMAKENTDFSAVEKLAEKYDAKIVGYIELGDTYQLRFSNPKSYDELQKLCEELRRESGIDTAELNLAADHGSDDEQTVLMPVTPNDSRYGDQWGAQAIRADAAWRFNDYLTPVNVGLIDSYVLESHEDLGFAEVFNNGSGDAGHGTHVAGIMAARFDNSTGVTGIYPFGDGHLYSASWHAGASGSYATSMTERAALADLAAHDVRVINMSFGETDRSMSVTYDGSGLSSLETESRNYSSYLKRMLDNGADFLLVTSAGNSSGTKTEGTHWRRTSNQSGGWNWQKIDPLNSQDYAAGEYYDVEAKYNSWMNYIPYLSDDASRTVAEHIIVVGACTETGSGSYRRRPSSNDWDGVDIIAPGSDILSCYAASDSDYEYLSGTSMAAPHAAGAAAAVWSVNPDLSGPQVKELLLGAADTTVSDSGKNMLDMNAAVTQALAVYGNADGKHLEDIVDHGVLTGTVIDGVSGEPISGATVTAGQSSAQTDAGGVFELELKPGEQTVTVSAQNYESYSTTQYITAAGLTDLNRIKLFAVLSDFTVPETLTVGIGAEMQIPLTATPAQADVSRIRWSSSDPSVVNVLTQGMVIALKEGTADITASAEIGGKTVTRVCKVTVDETVRDCVLVLDMSGSMDGEPLSELREAANSFCEQLFSASPQNRVAFVIFGSEVRTYDFVTTLSEAQSIINTANDGGMTNMNGGLIAAGELLDNGKRSNAIGNIVIMADGGPNEGSELSGGEISAYCGYDLPYHDAVCVTARELRTRYNIYSLGFYHNVSVWDNETRDIMSYFMRSLASDSADYYDVTDGSQLVFAFGDIAASVVDGACTVICIACPVDVTIRHEGEMITSSDPDALEADFGRITLYGQDNDIKLVRLKAGIDYDIALNGIGEGSMDYSIMHYSSDSQLTDQRSFEDVPLNSSMRGKSTTATDKDTELLVDTDGDGEYGMVWRCGANGSGSVIGNSEQMQRAAVSRPTVAASDMTAGFVAAGAALIGLTVLIIVMMKRGSRQESVPAPAEQPAQADLMTVRAPEIAVQQSAPVRLPGSSQGNLITQNVQVTQAMNGTHDVTQTVRQLQVIGGSMNGMALGISADADILIGRAGNGANLALAPDYIHVARRHCLVRYDSARKMYLVTDLGSVNGTLLSNGTRLQPNQPVLVMSGEILTLADADCRIRLG